MKKGLKETLELLDGMKAVAAVGLDVAKDGFTSDDMPKLMGFFSQYDVISKAINGMGDIDDEIKDLDVDEIQMLVDKVLEIVKSLKDKA